MKQIVIIITFLLIIPTLLFAQEQEKSEPLSIITKYHAGLRLGVWVNNGESHDNLITTDPTVTIKSSIKDANFYLDGYYGYNLLPATFLEFSFGVVNRGSVTIQDGSLNDYGNLLLYPFVLQAKLYPLAALHSRFQPFIAAGGGVYYGRHSIQFTNNIYSYNGYNNESATDFNYVVSGGADWLLSSNFSIEGNMKYMPIKFSDLLVGVKDYKALTITVGLKYRYN